MSQTRQSEDVCFAARHALFWLIAGNAAGCWLALLLLFPQLNFGEITYGRIVPVHLNLQLYGWSSLPLIAWLLHIFPAKSRSEIVAGRSAILAWSLALAMGAMSWLAGRNSGKIFLEWTGLARVALPLAMLFLWAVLASRFWRNPHRLKAAGLFLLLPVPLIWYWASSPRIYPAVNPDTSGPTGASLLGSTLAIVLPLLLLGPILGQPVSEKSRTLPWLVFFGQILVFAFANKSNSSHHTLEQVLILALLLLWIPILPLHFRRFEFPDESRHWLKAAVLWFAFLTLTGWVSFLPRVLDAFKFTNALVAHSHLAMAGFVTALHFFLLAALLGWKTDRSVFWLWNAATLAHVVAMWGAGACEAVDPAFTILPSFARTSLYAARALAGLVMLGCSVHAWHSLSVAPPADISVRRPSLELAAA